MSTVIVAEDVTACKEKKYETKSSGVTVVFLHAVHTVQYTSTGKCNLFVLYNKNSNGLLKDLGGMEKEKQVC